MSALREKIEITSHPPESLSYNYEGIADVGLQQFLDKFEEILQKEVTSWPTKAATIRNLIPNYHQLLYDWVLQNNILSLTPSPRGKFEYDADKDQMLALAAINFIYPQHSQDLNGRMLKTLSHTRAALGSHHLASLLNDPSLREKIKRTTSLKNKEGQDYYEEDDAIKVEAVDKKTPQRPSDIIPNFDTEQLAELNSWDIPKIEQGLEKLKKIIEGGPSCEEHSTAKTGITPCVAILGTFIYAADQTARGNKELFANFDIQQTPTSLELFRTLDICLAYLQEHTPKINNLRQLFLALKQYINDNGSLNHTPQTPEP